ncbi:galactose mutarotase (plasmid) [Deinococcus metallilatus]|uniref:Aldose 1-epimerase n=1 Tax=Deinococcus metallilatus TaxID=1211322 RepID=A0AAJ5JZU9_9DEIO|nr:aldose epimerase family protein [Deinococcus metallilatus]MBB5293358.1 aldose 1-epimerase [Deinococcus metallilatus]QBY06464.1 galactose mutarotase [Deinococcus metallilatus]RXJ17807.1 galactose mutarotase [Deinococcus metallilatus]TLK32079.1 galactose mutarotase [Deinococcus metallilatus]GMA15419.1 aldose 1-epimerase [Deinococcus metallilatus]
MAGDGETGAQHQDISADRAGTVSERPWGETPDGRSITLYELETPGGLRAGIMTYGGVLVRLFTPDRHGLPGDIVLGHDRPEPYFDRTSSPFFGALIGRYANRIAGGRFTLQGRTYQLAQNDGPNALHGGERGFDQRLWDGHAFVGEDGPGVMLTYLSPDGEEGYPGNLAVRVTYTLTLAGALRIDYAATTDAPTPVNLTNHTYWNLTGNAGRDILGHELTVQAEAITPVDAGLIPTGELREVAGTPFDFREARRIGARVDEGDEQLRYAGGYDHNFVLRGGAALHPAARLYDPATGRQVEVSTTEPGLQVYSGNFLDGRITGKGGQRYGHRWAVCLEAQHFPDSPNQPQFPPAVLLPGQHFSSRTVYAFSTR